MKELFPCPCCGFRVHDEPPGSHDICPICFWEDDPVQLLTWDRGGANGVSLRQGQANFARIGVCEARMVMHVRSVQASDVRDPEWRPLDPAIERVASSEGAVLPDDLTKLYYWREK